jgi:hypothetical protein
MTRLFSVAMALLAGLLAVFLLDLALGAPGALAQEKKNCPAGFVWERWSPNGCSQEKLPEHGYIDYDGWGTCEAGYQADIEQRPTTDGKPPPGSPRTSFPYLKAMNVSHGQWGSMIENIKAQLPAAKKTYVDLNSQVRDLESNLGAVQQELYGQ